MDNQVNALPLGNINSCVVTSIEKFPDTSIDIERTNLQNCFVLEIDGEQFFDEMDESKLLRVRHFKWIISFYIFYYNSLK